MAELYDKCKENFLTGKINWLEDDIKVILIGDGYEVDIHDDEFFSSIPFDASIAVSASLTGKTAEYGIANASDIIIYDVVGQCRFMVLFKDTGDENTSPLIAYFDLGAFPQANHIDIKIVWDNSLYQIFSL